MNQQEIFKKDRKSSKSPLVIGFQQDFSFIKKSVFILGLGMLLITASSFEVVEDAEKVNNSSDPSVECKTETNTNLHNEDSLVNTFLEYIPGLREYLFRFKRTDLKKTC
jgi:hypothetical protein